MWAENESDGKGRKGTGGQHDDAWNRWPAISNKAWQRRHCAERLAACEKAWRAGLPPAVAHALEICRLYRQPPPEWVIEAVTKVVKEHPASFHAIVT